MAESVDMFKRILFVDAIDASYLDGINGFKIWNLFELQTGLSVPAGMKQFLTIRPDIQYSLQSGLGFLQEYPTYVMVGSAREVKDFYLANPELVDSCRCERIHVIGGEYTSFWDCYDETWNTIHVEEYPGSADDAATYGNVTITTESNKASVL